MTRLLIAVALLLSPYLANAQQQYQSQQAPPPPPQPQQAANNQQQQQQVISPVQQQSPQSIVAFPERFSIFQAAADGLKRLNVIPEGESATNSLSSRRQSSHPSGNGGGSQDGESQDSNGEFTLHNSDDFNGNGELTAPDGTKIPFNGKGHLTGHGSLKFQPVNGHLPNADEFPFNVPIPVEGQIEWSGPVQLGPIHANSVVNLNGNGTVVYRLQRRRQVHTVAHSFNDHVNGSGTVTAADGTQLHFTSDGQVTGSTSVTYQIVPEHIPTVNQLLSGNPLPINGEFLITGEDTLDGPHGPVLLFVRATFDGSGTVRFFSSDNTQHLKRQSNQQYGAYSQQQQQQQSLAQQQQPISQQQEEISESDEEGAWIFFTRSPPLSPALQSQSQNAPSPTQYEVGYNQQQQLQQATSPPPSSAPVYQQEFPQQQAPVYQQEQQQQQAPPPPPPEQPVYQQQEQQASPPPPQQEYSALSYQQEQQAPPPPPPQPTYEQQVAPVFQQPEQPLYQQQEQQAAPPPPSPQTPVYQPQALPPPPPQAPNFQQSPPPQPPQQQQQQYSFGGSQQASSSPSSFGLRAEFPSFAAEAF